MSQSPRLESLLAAAREDAPTRGVKDGVWTRIAAEAIAGVAKGGAGAAGGGTAGAGVVTSSAAAKAGAGVAVVAIAPSAIKLLAVGAVLGATAAGAAFLLLRGPLAAPSEVVRSAQPGGARSVNAPRPAPAAPSADLAPAFELPPSEPGASESLPSAKAPPPASVRPAAGARAPDAPDAAYAAYAAYANSALAEEARFVTEARRALVGGDPDGALAWIRRTKALPTRALEPEELALESRALRALGRIDEAWAADEALRLRYPAHALAH